MIEFFSGRRLSTERGSVSGIETTWADDVDRETCPARQRAEADERPGECHSCRHSHSGAHGGRESSVGRRSELSTDRPAYVAGDTVRRRDRSRRLARDGRGRVVRARTPPRWWP